MSTVSEPKFKKVGFSTESVVKTISREQALASPEVVARLEKFAKHVQKVAPRSDDFLYFSIIFLKAAESCLIDEDGNLKKVGNENAWGYFDDSWRWHGNVKPHKNKNCFVAGTRISMADGSVKNIEDIVAGDVVLTHLGRPKKVLHTMVTNYSGDLLKISIKNNEPIFCTPEHPFLKFDSVITKNKGLASFNRYCSENKVVPSYNFYDAKTISYGDLLVSPVIKERYKGDYINPNRARLLGIFAAEGCYTKKHNKRQGVIFTLGITEEKQADLIQSIFEEEFPECSVHIRKEHSRSVIIVTATGANIAEYFYYHVGEFSHEKKLSKEIVYSDDESKKQFICGWLDGDGCKGDYNKLIGITTSASMAYQIRTMLNSLEASVSLRRVPSNDKKCISKKYGEYAIRDHYRIEMYGGAYKALGIDKNTIKYSFDERKHNVKYNYFDRDNNYRLHCVKNVTTDYFFGNVYNFEVEDDHSYIANGIAVHNCDIFPEAELRKAAKSWIGKPLCKDHESDSVDGIRGIILDTHYDERLKQVVGLCALDRINYPELARKVATGIVRFGSMGTAVEISVCSECGNFAKVASDYCGCITGKTAWGEINVGLKPIEYSLVVQPAEPGAKLLRCIASLEGKKDQLSSFGISSIDYSKYTEEQLDSLDRVLSMACGANGCSLEQREKIVSSYLNITGMVKNASLNSHQEEIAAFTKSLTELKNATGLTYEDSPELYQPLFEAFNIEMPRTAPIEDKMSTPLGETFSSGQSASGSETIVTKDDQGVSGTGGESSGLLASVNDEKIDTFETGGVGPEHYAFASKEDKYEIKSILEDIMKESKLNKRAEERRRIAYHQGGSDGVEPNTFKSEDYHKYWNQDKHMHPNPKSLGGDDGMFPGDEAVKTKQKRAEDEGAKPGLKSEAYHQGGSDGVEPNTFKSEDYHKYWNQDKHMHPNPKSLGGTDGMFPGDEAVKTKQKRASYSTKFKQRRNLDGSINKAASCFEVYEGDKLVIATTARDIFGPKLEENWSWLTSPDYGRAVVAQIREDGLSTVAKVLTKKAQEVPAPAPMPAAPAAPAAPEMDMGAEPAPMDEPMDTMPMDEDLGPRETIEEALIDIEERIDEIRGALTSLGGSGAESVDVDINVGQEPGMDEEKLSLSRALLSDLKVALAEASESADELALLSDAYDKENYKKLSGRRRTELSKIAKESLRDSAELIGETSALLRMAKSVAASLVKTSEYVEKAPEVKKTAAKQPEPTSSLVAEALELRRRRREAFLKQAEEALEAMEKEEDKQESNAEDCMTEEVPEEVVNEAKDHTSTPAQSVAVKSVSQVSHAEDAKVEEKTEEKVEEKVENKAEDAVVPSTVQAKLSDSFIKKKTEEEREAYRLKVRRAYDVAMEMQRKGMIPANKAALDQQVDHMLEFDDRAFESYKRAVANTKPVVKVASTTDLGGVNIGINEQPETEVKTSAVDLLSKMWK